MKAEDLLQQLPSRAAIPQIWTSVAWLDCFKARVSKMACFKFTFFVGLMNCPMVQVLCCVKELLEQFVPEIDGQGEKSYHLLMHPFILHSIANGCQLRFYEPRLSFCKNLFFPA